MLMESCCSLTLTVPLRVPIPSAIEGEIVVMSGATGKVIKSSKVNISALNEAIAKAHEHANKDKLDTYTKTQGELLAAASVDARAK